MRLEELSPTEPILPIWSFQACAKRIDKAIAGGGLDKLFFEANMWMGHEIRKGNGVYATQCVAQLESAYDDVYEKPDWIQEVQNESGIPTNSNEAKEGGEDGEADFGEENDEAAF